MNLFVWNRLKDRKVLGFALRRPYSWPFEAAILENYIIGDHYRDMLFRLEGKDIKITGYLAPGITVSDFVKLDEFHAVEEKIHSRFNREAIVMRGGKLEKVPCYVYSAGAKFTKLGGIRIL